MLLAAEAIISQAVKSGLEQYMVTILEEFGHHDHSKRVHITCDIIWNQDLN